LVVNVETIKNEMYIARITGIEMAKKLKISQTSFYKKINGKRQFTANELGLIASVLEKEVNFFYI